MTDRDEDLTFSIGDLADHLDITTRSIRFYEDHGLLKPKRTSGNIRVYDYRDRARLQLIVRGKRLGFTLNEIGEWLSLYEVGDDQKQQIDYIARKVADRRQQLLQQQEDITQSLAELDAIQEQIVSEQQRRQGTALPMGEET